MKQKRSKMSFEDVKSTPYQRHRNILYLIAQYLNDFGLKEARLALLTETNLSSDYRVCDNIDLDTIYLDYCSYYHLKFGKQPKIVKKVNDVILNPKIKSNKCKNAPEKVNPSLETRKQNEEFVTDDLAVAGLCFGETEEQHNGACVPRLQRFNNDLIEQFVGEMRDLAYIIEKDIVKSDCKIKWKNVQGNDHVKLILKESVILPLTYPHLFTELTKPWKGVLLHGVSGVGKTLMAKALNSETFDKVTFFNMSASTLISKWRGESEKFLKVLFTMAKRCSPSIIFIDEFESLASRRDSSKDHEATMRFKNEFLIQIDELDADDGNVLLLANSNLPWEIDVAFLRRFERKILVDLPDAKSRADILKHLLSNTCSWPDSNLTEIISLSDGFTGADLKTACKEASMKQIRRIIQSNVSGSLAVKVPAVNFDDLKLAFAQIKPTMIESAAKHRQWNKKHGNWINGNGN